MILNNGKLGMGKKDVARLLGCDYDHSILRTPAKTGKQDLGILVQKQQTAVVYFIGGVTYTEIAALRFLAAQENFPYEILIATTNITNGTRILNEMKPQEPSKLPDADANANAESNSLNPF
ncbi:LOW QUALITY PROTEIN: uncharacterized protein [Blastocystis hominis]|uniref:Uncharacterized protein n=1 Tax=Blastocystis hominis TaxID=12968 RepID=D8LYG0_BLAHO|nr:LOW QUALITY PROTEIN: uncharacterized protein [Blastocystis hominis]CBK20615.2 unnamed protein product [Blastocystis hominis]|eukprot:XP_012894663.1 LOW QUALITY PROTEIN: uncharacterized protein [Blastocystis hominis]